MDPIWRNFSWKKAMKSVSSGGRLSSTRPGRHIFEDKNVDNKFKHYGDLTDTSNLTSFVRIELMGYNLECAKPCCGKFES